MTKLILGASIASLLSSSAFAATITLPGDPIGGGDTSVDGLTFTITPNFSADESIAKVIDGDPTTKVFRNTGPGSGYVATPAIGSSVVTGIDFVTGNDNPDRDPTSFSLYGSNTVTANDTVGTTYNFSNFTLIASQALTLPSTDDDAGRRAPGSASFGNTVAYTSYLLTFPTVRNGGDFQLSEATLTGTAIPEPSTLGLLGLTTIGIAALRRRRA